MRCGRAAIGAFGVAAALGCGGGFWQEFHGEELSELYVLVETSVPPSDLGRPQVLDVITDVWVASWEHGGLGFWEAVQLDMVVEDAVADGAVDPGEVLIVRERASGLLGTPVDAARRQEILEIKEVYDARARLGNALTPPTDPPPVEIEPDEVDVPVEAPAPALRAALEAAGWTIASCSADQTSCRATRDALDAVVERIDDLGSAAPEAAVRFVGDGVVAVTVRDAGTPSRSAAEALADALVP